MATLRIKELMEESRKVGRRVTQADLAKDAGVAQQTIARLANNQRKRLDPVILQSLADTFSNALNRKITIYDLIEDDDLIQKDERQGQESSITPSEPDKPAPDTSSKDDEVLRAIEHLENRMDKGFAEVSQQMANLSKKVSKLS